MGDADEMFQPSIADSEEPTLRCNMHSQRRLLYMSYRVACFARIARL